MINFRHVFSLHFLGQTDKKHFVFNISTFAFVIQYIYIYIYIYKHKLVSETENKNMVHTERYGVSLRVQPKCVKIRTRKNSVFRLFSRSVEQGNKLDCIVI